MSANIEEISQVAMNVITYAGMAKSNYIQSIRAFKDQDQELFESLISDGDVELTKAHHAHFEILQAEMSKGEPQITLLLAHAEDQLMSCETIKVLIVEFTEILKNMREK